MSSLIEQAAQRLEQLRQAGVEIPQVTLPRGGAEAAKDLRATPAAAAMPEPPVSQRIELDIAAMGRAGIIAPSAARSPLADQFRVLKRPLIGNATGKGASNIKRGNLIMVTSAVPGEGKSFTAANLAMSIAAELDHTVMLVDADVGRPAIPRMLGFEAGPGLLDLLQARADMASVLLRTNIEKLTILPSGTPHPRATELLASAAMAQLLDEIASRYPDRIVVFDSPPLLPTTESRVLAAQMGQVVIVVQADHTLQSHVEHALATIESCPVRLMVLNQARAVGRQSHEYGYGYGYGYGYNGVHPGGAARDAAI
jgi:protein-tyrosine kinase